MCLWNIPSEIAQLIFWQATWKSCRKYEQFLRKMSVNVLVRFSKWIFFAQKQFKNVCKITANCDDCKKLCNSLNTRTKIIFLISINFWDLQSFSEKKSLLKNSCNFFLLQNWHLSHYVSIRLILMHMCERKKKSRKILWLCLIAVFIMANFKALENT